jgi:hypothetical protein
MFDHFTQIAATNDHFSTESDELSLFCAVDAPPVQVEHLPQGLIEDQI